MASSTSMIVAGRTAFLLFMLLSGCQLGQPPIQGSGVSKTEARTVTDFDSVDVSAAIRLELAVGPAATLEVTADDNLLPFVKTEITDKDLKIFVDRNFTTSIGIKVKATTPALKALNGSGATNSTVTGVETKTFNLDLSGASICNLSCKAEQMSMDLSGASQCTLTGEVERLTIHSSGASRINATDVNAKVVEADLSGASAAEVRASDELTAKASGASTLRYTGAPEKLQKQVSGASTVGPK